MGEIRFARRAECDLARTASAVQLRPSGRSPGPNISQSFNHRCTRTCDDRGVGNAAQDRDVGSWTVAPLLAAVCEQMDSGKAVDGVGTVDDPPVLGEAAVSEDAAQLVGVPAPSRGYRVVERCCGARHVG